MLRFVFPNVCVSCQKHVVNIGICDDCYSSISFLEEKSGCSVCGIPFNECSENSCHLSARCLNHSLYFTRARFVAHYDGLIRELLHLFKYRGKLYIGKLLSDIFVMNVPRGLGFFDLILPVPVHLNRLRKREYNQSAILGKNFSVSSGCVYDPFALCKVRDTLPQVSFKSLKERKKNVKDAFSVRDAARIKGTSVLLIDDVFTTGSTVNECSKVLLEAGAASVQVLTLTTASRQIDF